MSAPPSEFSSATHAILFEPEDERCSVCSGEVPKAEADLDDGLHTAGHGLFVWARGDEIQYEEPPLCSECAVAIGITALQRWEAEEDEG